MEPAKLRALENATPRIPPFPKTPPVRERPGREAFFASKKPSGEGLSSADRIWRKACDVRFAARALKGREPPGSGLPGRERPDPPDPGDAATGSGRSRSDGPPPRKVRRDHRSETDSLHERPASLTGRGFPPTTGQPSPNRNPDQARRPPSLDDGDTEAPLPSRGQLPLKQRGKIPKDYPVY